MAWLVLDLLRDKKITGYCSNAAVPRGVFTRFLRENPECNSAKLRFLQFLCIAKRVAVNRVNSDDNRFEICAVISIPSQRFFILPTLRSVCGVLLYRILL